VHFLNQLSEYQGTIRLIYTCFCISVLIKIAVNNDWKNLSGERRSSLCVFTRSHLKIV
jgi:hypothetical protein